MLASWVQQAGFEPPMVSVAVNQKRYLNDWLNTGSSLVLNLVGEGQKQFLSHFGKGFEPGESAFEGVVIERSSQGNPILKEALGWLEGKITGSIASGDHTIYMVELTAAGKGPELDIQKPYVHIRKNGLGY